MAYTVEVKGVKEIEDMLEKLGMSAYSAASQGLYNGAGVMANEIRNSAERIRTAPFKYARKPNMRLPSPEEKAIVLAAKSAGIAKFKKRVDQINTSVGYAKSGYAPLKGKMKPIPLIANSINSGTSFMQRQAFSGNPSSGEARRRRRPSKKPLRRDWTP